MADTAEKNLHDKNIEEEEEQEEESVGSLKPRQRSNATDDDDERKQEEEKTNGEEIKSKGEEEKASEDNEKLNNGNITEEKSNGIEKENREVKEQPASEEENGVRSIHLDQEQGVWKCRHCTWTYALSCPGIDHFQSHEDKCQLMMDIELLLRHVSNIESQTKDTASSVDVSAASSTKRQQFTGEDLVNGACSAGQSNFQDELPVAQKVSNLKNIEIEGVSNSSPSSGIYAEENMQSIEVKIQSNSLPSSQNNSDGGVILVNKTKSEIAEFDVERVLEEQDTHDLYCPNCNSCITRRVILRKRKRVVKHHPYDAKRGKLLEDQPSHDASFSQAETTEQGHEREPDVFRCLSCFSFFIPTDCGFSIFHIFSKRDENVNLHTSQEMPQETPLKNSNLFSFIFRKTSYMNIGTGAAGIPLLGGSSVTSGNQIHTSQNTQIISSASPSTAGMPLLGGSSVTSGNEIHTSQNTQIISSASPSTAGMPLLGGSSVTSGNEIHTSQNTQIISSASPSTGGVSQIFGLHGNEAAPTPETLQKPDTLIPIPEPVITERRRDWEVLKSVVYGGLIESIASLAVVSSAAGSHTATYNIVALGLANLIGGLFLISHDLSDLKNEPQETNQDGPRSSRYWKLLGRKENFLLHAIVAVLSYIIFGLLPPVVYAFSFYKSDNKEYKLMAVAGVAMICISLLALAKAHVGRRAMYFKTMAYYLGNGFAASGLSYVAGVLIDKLIAKLGLFDRSADPPTPSSFAVIGGAHLWVHGLLTSYESLNAS